MKILFIAFWVCYTLLFTLKVDLSKKAKLIERAINTLDFASDADVKPIAYESEKGKKSFFPKQVRINKNLKNDKDN